MNYRIKGSLKYMFLNLKAKSLHHLMYLGDLAAGEDEAHERRCIGSSGRGGD